MSHKKATVELLDEDEKHTSDKQKATAFIKKLRQDIADQTVKFNEANEKFNTAKDELYASSNKLNLLQAQLLSVVKFADE